MSTLKIPHTTSRAYLTVCVILLFLMILRVSSREEWEVYNISILIVWLGALALLFRKVNKSFIEVGENGISDNGNLIARLDEITDIRMTEYKLILTCKKEEKSISVFDVSRHNRIVLVDVIKKLITNR